jgi:hypothetical protein
MKKMLALFLALCLVLLVGSLALAATPDAHGNISNATGGQSTHKTISAYVSPYAELYWTGFTAPEHLTGEANKSQNGFLKFRAAANCAVDIILDVNPMQTQGDYQDVSTLTTLYAITSGNDTPDYRDINETNEMIYSSALDQSSDNFTVNYQVQTGDEIFSQHAGDYSAKINLTIVAQAY